jgi:NAD(P)-dependent dehydrogenase (short-subunit alcohol dehydrogenase family)
MNSLANKVAIITGAGVGIGRAAAELFAQAGATVIVAERDTATGAAAAEAVRAAGGKALFVETDVTQPDSVEAMTRHVIEAYGHIDVLYNNAGGSTTRDAPVVSVPLDEFWRTINVDLFGTFLCCRFAIPHMIAAGGGAVVNTSSMVALIGRKNAHSYTAAKGAIGSLTRAMAAEYAQDKIRVNAVAPGVTLSERVAARLETGRIQPYVMDRHMLGFPEPIDIAKTALFLASEDARRITGQIVPVDSGMTAT